MTSFKLYRDGVNESLADAGVNSNDIQSLLNCRMIINGQQEYLHDLSARYYEHQRDEESLYKNRKATVILAAKNASQGKVEVDLKDPELRAQFTEAERTYKTVRGFLETLNGRDDILKQRISYLKQEQSLNNFVK